MSGTVYINHESDVTLGSGIFHTLVQHLEESLKEHPKLLSSILGRYRDCCFNVVDIWPGELSSPEFRCVAAAIESIALKLKNDYAKEWSSEKADYEQFATQPLDALVALLQTDQRRRRNVTDDAIAAAEDLIAERAEAEEFFKQIGLDEILNQDET
jgi:hypothetical protein